MNHHDTSSRKRGHSVFLRGLLVPSGRGVSCLVGAEVSRCFRILPYVLIDTIPTILHVHIAQSLQV